MSHPEPPQQQQQPQQQPSDTRAAGLPPRSDARLAIQAEKLRINAMSQAIRFGSAKPAIPPRGLGILIGSTLIGLFALGATVGLSAVLQWFSNR